MLKVLLVVSFFLFTFSPTLYAQKKLKVAHMLYSSLDASKKDIETTLTLWITDMGKHINIPVETHFYNSIEDVKKDMSSGKVNYMLIKPMDVIKYFDLEKLIDGYSPARKRDNIHNKLILVVRKDSQIKSIKDLKNKTLGLSNNNEIKTMYIDTLLMNQNLPKSKKFLSKTIKYTKNSKALLELFFKKIDVAIITKGTLELMNEMNPQIGKSTKILEEKSILLGNVGFFSINTDKEIIDKFNKGIKQLHDSERSKQILTLFKAERLERTNREELKKLKEFYTRYKILKKKNL